MGFGPFIIQVKWWNELFLSGNIYFLLLSEISHFSQEQKKNLWINRQFTMTFPKHKVHCTLIHSTFELTAKQENNSSHHTQVKNAALETSDWI